MNLPVLFRTIDGASQVTIETQYADDDLFVQVTVIGMAKTADYVSLSSKGYEPLVCAPASVRHVVDMLTLREGAGRPATAR